MASTDESSIRSTIVEKTLQLDYDLGNLLASDPNDLSARDLKISPDAYLKSLTRDNTQLLFNQVWTLPFERVDDVVIAKLPKPTFLLPREKPVPKAKPLTKWQTYAKDKGITKRKKTKLVWDEIVNAWVPRFGYRRAVAQHEKDWVLEVPQNADPFEDQFEKKTEAKSERVAKNELQRLKNIARSRNVNVPATGLIPTERPSRNELHKAMHVAKGATASLGKFQEKLPKEKPLKKTGKKRTFDPMVQAPGTEKSMNLDVLNRIINKKPKLNLESAVSRKVQQEEVHEPEERRSGRTPKKGAKGQKNSKIKKGSARKGGMKKGRAAPRSKPKKKGH